MNNSLRPTIRPLDDLAASAWNCIPMEYRRALAIVLLVNLAAFGYEMGNLSFHHDDVVQFFRREATLGHQLGRYGYSWLHYYAQGNYYLPFFQLLEGILCTTAYALVAAYAWGMRKTAEVALIGSIICVYPYMAQLYQYDTSAFPFALAHLLAGLAALLSLRQSAFGVVVAIVLYAAAFSIYQSVIGNALVVLAFAMVSRGVSADTDTRFLCRGNAIAVARSLFAIVGGGLLYLTAVSISGVHIDSYQDADKAFSLSDGIDFGLAFSVMARGTQSALFWPENYFPLWLKQIQVAMLALAGLYCLLRARGVGDKVAVIAFLGLGLLAPRALQFLHPTGAFHNLTVTAYATVIAGGLMVVYRCAGDLVRNLCLIAAVVLTFGYLLQANWISTVNSLNWSAHQLTATQIFSRIHALPRGDWDGRTVAVVGKFEFADTYPFKKQTGLAVSFIDEEHFKNLAGLLRQNVDVRRSKELSADNLALASRTPPWPAPESVTTLQGMALVVLSPTPQK